jgi:5-methyltetrahydropteroyltriglutamate--homocysteine methyltransferase
MSIPTEPIGSIPRPQSLIDAAQQVAAGLVSCQELEVLEDEAVRDTIRRFEATGSPVITDGEQTKPSFATYPIDGLPNLAPEGVTIPFADGHVRQLPRLSHGPFRYTRYAAQYLARAKRHATVPVKQAVIAPSALSLLYPPDGIPDYPEEEFLEHLVTEAAADIRGCLENGAHTVQIDFTEGRLSLKLDPSGSVLRRFIDLNNRVLALFSVEERRRIGFHTCPGSDVDSTHSLDVDYADLLPHLFKLQVGTFYVQLASERDRGRVLSIIREHAPCTARIFVGVVDPIDPQVETPEEVADRVLEAASYISPERLGTCDDCGFAPFGDDVSTARDTAFDKIRSRVLGTELAAKVLCA